MIQHCLLACCLPFPPTSPDTGAVSTLAREKQEGHGLATGDGSPPKSGDKAHRPTLSSLLPLLASGTRASRLT